MAGGMGLCYGKVWTLPSASRGKSSEFQGGTQGNTNIGAEVMRPSKVRMGGVGIGGGEEEARRIGGGTEGAQRKGERARFTPPRSRA